MSNASAASRAASRAPSDKPAEAPDKEPELPFDHPSRVVAALFVEESPVMWKLPLHLGYRFSFATFSASSNADTRVLTVQCTLPLLAPTPKEQSAFRLVPEVPRLSFDIPADTIEATVALCLVHGIPGNELDAVARLVGQRLAEMQELPRGARQFIERWMTAVRDLTWTLLDMWWQAAVLESSRDAVHKARKQMRERAAELTCAWVGDRTEGKARV